MQSKNFWQSALFAVVLAAAAAASPRPVEVHDGRFDPAALTSQDPVLAELFERAREFGIRLGTWGGASRDFLLGRGSPPAGSDVDLIYHSEELRTALARPGTRRRIAWIYARLLRRYGWKRIRRYTFMDMTPGRSYTQSIFRLIGTGGLTLNQVGLMSDGTAFDPTGGLADLQAGVLRYRAPREVGEMIEAFDDLLYPGPYDVLRAVRFKVQYPELRWARGTPETLKQIMAAFAPGSPRTLIIASRRRGLRERLGRLVPRSVRRWIASRRNRRGKPRLRDLRPYLEKGFEKLARSDWDADEILRLLGEFGLDCFAREVGMGAFLTALEGRAAG